MLKLMFAIRCKTSFVVKEVLCRSLTSTQYKESFHCRILNYFNDTLNALETSPQYKVSMQCRENIPNINGGFGEPENSHNQEQQLEAIHENFKNLLTEKDSDIINKIIDDLDIQCFSILHTLHPLEILKLLNAFLKIIPHVLTKTYTYDKSISILIKAAEIGVLSNHETTQLLFFIALRKEDGATYINYLKPYLPDMNDLPLIEKSITAQSFYKASTKLQLRQSRLLEKLLEEDFAQLIADPKLLVPICKAIIISQPSNELTLKNLSKAIIELKNPLNFTTTAHILSLYAEALLLEPQAINQLVKNAIEMMTQNITDQQYNLNLTDIDTFLWAISYLGLTLTLNEKIVLRTYLEKRFKEYKKKENLGILVNSILCLHMLRCWSTKILIHCFQERIFNPIFYENFHWKIQSRLQLLISQITLEMKMSVPTSLRKQIKIGYTPSENLNLVTQVGFTLANIGTIKDCILECPIKTIIIPGVTIVTEKDTYHVDVLDNLTCLRNTNIPHGLMNLKLRLLSRLRYRQILIPGSIFTENTEETLSVIEQKILNNILYGKSLTLHKKKIHYK